MVVDDAVYAAAEQAVAWRNAAAQTNQILPLSTTFIPLEIIQFFMLSP